MVGELFVKAQADGDLPSSRKRHVVSRDVYLLESVAFFEITKRATLLLPISKFRIDQVLNSPIRTRSDGLCNQSICWRQISMSHRRDNIH